MIDSAAIATFYTVVFDGLDGFCAVRMFAEKGMPKRTPVCIWVPINADLPIQLTQAAQWAANEALACFVIPGALPEGRAKAEDVLAFHSIVLDIDTPPVEAKRTYISEHVGEPDLIVASGGKTEGGEDKLHLHWRLEAPATPSEVCAVREALALKAGGDVSFARAHQPVRLPGSVHGKGGVQRQVRIMTP
jgi:hypothetical protein